MDNFIVSALKYRPQTFKDVVGQSAITTTLEKAIENNHLAQALLFTGPRGVGKTSCARILAKLINSKGSVETDEDYAFNIFENCHWQSLDHKPQPIPERLQRITLGYGQ